MTGLTKFISNNNWINKPWDEKVLPLLTICLTFFSISFLDSKLNMKEENLRMKREIKSNLLMNMKDSKNVEKNDLKLGVLQSFNEPKKYEPKC